MKFRDCGQTPSRLLKDFFRLLPSFPSSRDVADSTQQSRTGRGRADEQKKGVPQQQQPRHKEVLQRPPQPQQQLLSACSPSRAPAATTRPDSSRVTLGSTLDKKTLRAEVRTTLSGIHPLNGRQISTLSTPRGSPLLPPTWTTSPTTRAAP